MHSVSTNVHEHADERFDVEHTTYDGTQFAYPYVHLKVGPVDFFVRDEATLMAIIATCAEAFNELATAKRALAVSTDGAPS